MKAAIFYGGAVVKVAYCSICGSDRHKYYHGWPFPLEKIDETFPNFFENNKSIRVSVKP